MAPVVQQSAVNDQGFTSGTIQTATLNTKALTPGSMIVADFAVADAALNPTLTDPLGLTWTLAGTPVYWANIGNRIGTFWAQNPSSSAASLTVTATYSAAKVSRVLALREVTGLDSSGSPVDVVATGKNNSSTTAPTSNPMTTTAAGDWIHSVASSDGGTLTAGAGYTVDTNGTSSLIVSEYTVGGAAGSVTVPWVQSGTQQCLVFACAFKAAAGGGSNAATLSGKTPVLTGAMAGTSTNPATLSGKTPVLVGFAYGDMNNVAALTGRVPVLTGALPGGLTNPASLAGSVPVLTGLLPGGGVASNPATLAGSVPRLTGLLTGTSTDPAVLAGAVPVLAGFMYGDMVNRAVLAGAVPVLTGRFREVNPVAVNVTVTFGPTRSRAGAGVDGTRAADVAGTRSRAEASVGGTRPATTIGPTRS